MERGGGDRAEVFFTLGFGFGASSRFEFEGGGAVGGFLRVEGAVPGAAVGGVVALGRGCGGRGFGVGHRGRFE